MILIRQHGDNGPPGLLVEWLETRGIAYAISRSDEDGVLPDPREYEAVITLGSKFGPNDDEPAVKSELVLLKEAVDSDVPVMGLCFGGQALAKVLGGTVEHAPKPELGWREIESDDPSIPSGPWLEWHFLRFTTPPGATELARTEDAVQAFRQGRHLGVQFHPESTVDIVEKWATNDDERALIEAPQETKQAAREAAFRLFDAFRGETG